MLRSSFVGRVIFKVNFRHEIETSTKVNNAPLLNVCNLSCLNIKEINKKMRFFFARRVAQVSKLIQLSKDLEPANTPQKPKAQQPSIKQKKQPYFKATQNYTFSDLDKDLQMYQEYLNIFNTHTKKAHEKLVKNEIKIIQCIIQAKREDLLNKFLATNYRNRLANPQTLVQISKYYVKKIRSEIDQIIQSASQCQSLLQAISLLAEYNEAEAFTAFLDQLNTKYDIHPQSKNKEDYILKVLEKLPSRECQFLTLYNFLIQQKDLPEYLMQSQWFGIHTQNLKFHNLGQTFYQIRKFMRRYFAIYNKKLETQEELNELKTFERQSQKSSKSSSLQNDVLCFLKTLNYQNVRKEIQIDGFIVDFVIDGVKSKQKTLHPSKTPLNQTPTSTILEVMGSYHYTSRGKLKIRDVRKLILLGSKYRQKRYNIKLIHFEDLNRSKGFRNKLELIKNTLESEDQSINWQASHKGFDSNWQLKEHYEEFK